jgi:CheY-like chemotaxis protein
MPMLLAGVRVLLVEDDEDTRMLLAFALEGLGATVTEVPSAEAALESLASKVPDALVTDLMLPEMSGIELVRELRRRAPTLPLPLIALTARDSVSARAETLAAGFHKHLVKPTATADLASAIAVLLKVRPETSEELGQVRSIVTATAAASPCRYTSVLRFAADGTLVSLWTHDREAPDADPFPLQLPVEASYCRLIRDTGAPVAVADSQTDARASGHPKRDELRTYTGVPLRAPDGHLFGTLCCYDAAPQVLAPELDSVLSSAADKLVKTVVAWGHANASR